tara:strand:+ start:675 stop:863 length:189 start_codon:yes stop_codon:yes gene_type:complete
MADTLTYKKVKINDVDVPDMIQRETRNGASDVAFIPIIDLNNRDAVEYKEWVDAGNTPANAD